MKHRIRAGAFLALASVLSMTSVAAFADFLNRPVNPGGEEPKAMLLNRDDMDFLDKAHRSSMGEIKLARLAEERASSDAVKRLARRLIDDHTALDNRVTDIARNRRHDLATEVHWTYDMDHKRFSDLKGEDFDRAWLAHMEESHEKGIKTFTQARAYCTDRDVCHLAARSLPTLHDHLNMIRDLRAGR